MSWDDTSGILGDNNVVKRICILRLRIIIQLAPAMVNHDYTGHEVCSVAARTSCKRSTEIKRTVNEERE